MAFLLNNKTSLFSQLRFQSRVENPLARSSRGYHVELGEREKALLADDPALRRFKSHKKGVRKIKKIGDVLTIVVVASCCYEIYVRTTIREEARKAVKSD